ncbi:MAG TPA: phage tail family protein [Candidatus Mediterraneibacter excrementigallinarum]|nr:phage tail family protein [Candidatus Mediterraneibacter excrementigallinarum]
MSTGVTFDNRIHTERDWGLKLISVYIPMPDPKTQTVDIPGGDGTIDLTEIYGRPAYKDRDGLELAFDLMDGDYTTWFMKYSQFAAEIHGRKVKMVLDDDPDHYYMVRLNLDGKKSNQVYSQITFSGSAEPFKYDLIATNEPWLWDPFNFETGVIREIGEVEITAKNNTVTIIGAGVDTPPVFVVSQADNLQLTYGGRTYTLQVGRNRFPAVRVGKEDVTLMFSGTGKFEIEYRGRYL